MSTLLLPARLTIGEARATLEQLLPALAAADATPVLDASPLKALDTSAVGVLLECQRHAQSLGKHLVVQGAPDKLRALASLYGVEALLGLEAATT